MQPETGSEPGDVQSVLQDCVAQDNQGPIHRLRICPIWPMPGQKLVFRFESLLSGATTGNGTDVVNGFSFPS